MIFEGEFFSDGHLRWNLGWQTPNYAGAFLVTLLALAFVFSCSRWRWTALLVEAGGLFLLAKTYSRGAVVAYGLAWLFGVVASRGWRDQTERLVWAARIAVLAVIMFAVGFGWSRVKENRDGQIHGASASDGPTRSLTAEKIDQQEDGSVVNRLALWRGGLQMLAAAPWVGWGAGESGRAYMNWFQDIDRTEGYTTMVNSYLHVGVEHGLWTLVVVFSVLGGLLMVAWCGARVVLTESTVSRYRFPKFSASVFESFSFSIGAGAAIVAWAVANIFTTLWIDPKLWIVPGIAGLVLGWSAWKNSRIRFVPLTLASLAVAVFAVGGLYGAGRWLQRNQPLTIVPGTNGAVMVESAGSSGAVWHVWPDPVVLGPTPGKELRRWLAAQPHGTRLIAHRAVSGDFEDGGFPADGVMLLGRQVERFRSGFVPVCRELWLVHPLGAPPPQSSAIRNTPAITVVLPEIDEPGNGSAWRGWTGGVGAHVSVSTSSGLDIRAVWPESQNGFRIACERK